MPICTVLVPSCTLQCSMQLFQHIIQGRGGAGETIRIDVPANQLIPQLGRHGRGAGISAHIRLERAPRTDGRSDGRGFEPLLTRDRWAEEVKSLHGRFEQSRVTKITGHVVLALLPEAIEAHKKAKSRRRKRLLGAERHSRKPKRKLPRRGRKRRRPVKKRSAREVRVGSDQVRPEQKPRSRNLPAKDPPGAIGSCLQIIY